jgi:hypothetical protein
LQYKSPITVPASYTIIIVTFEAMREETKAFIARVHEYNPSATSPTLDAALTSTIDSLKNPTRRILVDPDQLGLLKSLLSVKFGYPMSGTTQKEVDDTLSTLVAALATHDNSDANKALYALLTDLKSHELSEAEDRWGINWDMMMCWTVALLGIVEGWGIAFEVLEEFIGKASEDEKYVEELRDTVEVAYEIKGLDMMQDASRVTGVSGV